MATVEQLAAMKDTKINLKTYNQTTIVQLGICRVKLENNDKCKICNFYLVPENKKALFGLPDIEYTKHPKYKLQSNRYRERIQR